MTINEEKFALINYLETKNPGSVIREIIETRIRVLNDKHEYIGPINARGVRVKYNDFIYPSISKASDDLNIPLSTLKDDIRMGKFRYNVRLVSIDGN